MKRPREDDDNDEFENVISIIESKNAIRVSAEQRHIFEFVQNNTKNMVIDSVAGSGKTSTLVQCLWFIPTNANVLILSFNKNVQQTLQHSVNRAAFQMGTTIQKQLSNCSVSTSHSHGLTALKRAFPNAGDDPVFDNKYRTVDEIIREENKIVQGALKNWKWHITSMLKLLFNLGVDCTPETKWSEEFIVEAGTIHGVPIPVFMDSGKTEAIRKQNISHGSYFDVLKKAYDRCCERQSGFDYEDMIYLPVKWNLLLTQYDVVMVDEAQDLNNVQIEMIRRSVKPDTGRAIFVGDKHQSIYGFRGAHFEAIDVITKKFDAPQLPLHTCWRCPVSVIETAQELVPKIMAREGAPQGISVFLPAPDIVKILGQRNVNLSHTVLCRTNSPLIELVVSLSKAKIPCHLEASSLCDSLQKLVTAVEGAHWLDNGKSFLDKANKYVAWKKNAMLDVGEEAIEKNDMLESLTVIITSMKSYRMVTALQVRTRIESLFGNRDNDSVKLCTVHQAKGQEYDCVYVIRDDLMPHPSSRGNPHQEIQEQNLMYVAVTRSKMELYFFIEMEKEEQQWKKDKRK